MSNSKLMTTNLTDEERIGPPLKVWWIPQVPGKPFEVLLNSFAEAWVLLNALAQYDIFQFRNRIKPDYANAGGLMVLEDGEWTDWTSEDGAELDDLTLTQAREEDRDYYNSKLNEAANELSRRA